MTVEITERHIKAIHRNLVVFGYPRLKIEEVRAEVERMQRGEEPAGIIGMMARGMLEEAGLLPEEQVE